MTFLSSLSPSAAYSDAFSRMRTSKQLRDAQALA